jgi:pimeloyl-ACP methyl ester carboxylesterase
MTVSLARRIAAGGVSVYRFDFAGIGDSPARSDGQGLAEGVLSDVRETMDHLQQHFGFQNFIVAGLCSGADNGMRAAEVDNRIVGVAMFDPTIDRSRRWYWEWLKSRLQSIEHFKSVITLKSPLVKRMFGLSGSEEQLEDTESDEKPELYQVTYSDRADISRCLNSLVARKVRLFVIFTGSWSFIYNYESQFFDVYPEVNFGDVLTLSYRPSADHSFLDAIERKSLLDDLTSWVQCIEHPIGRL